MSLIQKFPTTGWANQNLKNTVEALLQSEDDFKNRKAHATLGSILLTLATVYKDDAHNIAQIISRDVPVVNRTQMKIANANPNSSTQLENCPTCPGTKQVTARNVQMPQVLPQSSTPTDNDIAAVEKQLVGEQTLVVSKEHTVYGFESAEAVWKYYSGDVEKLKEAAKVAGVANAMYDSNAKSLAKKIFATLTKK